MGIGKLFGGFGLEKNFIHHDEISVIKVWEDNALVDDFIVLLPRKRNFSAAQFNDKRILVNDFVMAFAQFAMNFHAKTNQLENLFFIEQFFHLCQFVQISAISVKCVYVFTRIARIYTNLTKRSVSIP